MRAHAAASFGSVRSSGRLHQDIEDISAQSAPHLTPHLRAHARLQGWPEEAVSHLHVKYEDGAFHPRYHEAGREIVEALEYGNLDQRPIPALRSWALHSHHHASDVHDRALCGVLWEELF